MTNKQKYMMVENYRQNVNLKIQSFISTGRKIPKFDFSVEESLDEVDTPFRQSDIASIFWKFDRSESCKSVLQSCQLCEADVLGPYFIYLKETARNEGKDTGREVRCCRTCVHWLEVDYPEEILNRFHAGLKLSFKGFQQCSAGKQKILFEVKEELLIKLLLYRQNIKKWIPLYRKDNTLKTSYPAAYVSYQEKKRKSNKLNDGYEIAILPPFGCLKTSENYVSQKGFKLDGSYNLKLSLREWYIHGGGYNFYLIDE